MKITFSLKKLKHRIGHVSPKLSSMFMYVCVSDMITFSLSFSGCINKALKCARCFSESSTDWAIDMQVPPGHSALCLVAKSFHHDGKDMSSSR